MERKKQKNPNKKRERQDKGMIALEVAPIGGEGDLQRNNRTMKTI